MGSAGAPDRSFLDVIARHGGRPVGRFADVAFGSKLRFEIEKLPRKSREERATKTIPKALHATIVGIGSMLALIILMIQAIWRP